MDKRIVLAGGCFWGVEDLLRKIPGIIDTEVGYAGGHTPDPTYNTVKTGTTGHAEAIEIDYDSAVITLAQIFDFFFRMHDPTTRNRQGNDVGSQYRSAIFVKDAEERAAAEKAIADETAKGRWKAPLTTTIEELKRFYPAEDYHQDYLLKNPGGYTCHYWRGLPPS
jgi:methionine-S-sulfoxide reductase